MRRRILSISYDLSLLTTRQMLLEQAGYQPISALGFTDAVQRCREGKFDLAIIGHSIPQKDKRALVQEIRQSCKAPVLSLYTTSEGPLEAAEYAIDANEGPAAVLNMVNQIVGTNDQNV
jgi:DNA-binding response OmpR family regulator